MGERSDEMTNTIRAEPEEKARIRSEIERTREDMSETINEIQHRLSPRHIASQAKESVKEATVGRVKQAARSVSDSASNLAESTRGAAVQVTHSVRQNPWPAVLLGAGTAWLLIDRARQRNRAGRATDVVDYEHDDGTIGYYEKVRSSAAAYGYDEIEETARRRGFLKRNAFAAGAVAAAVGVAVGLARRA
jgi:ElaB/YqjD/DUF883 family membrane-anchored ribosome-binding protein